MRYIPGKQYYNGSKIWQYAKGYIQEHLFESILVVFRAPQHNGKSIKQVDNKQCFQVAVIEFKLHEAYTAEAHQSKTYDLKTLATGRTQKWCFC